MPDTVGLEFRKPTSLQGISYKAKTNKSHRFENLYGCITPSLLLESFKGLNTKAAAGVDKVTYRSYTSDLWSNIQTLAKVVKDKRYKAQLVRRHYIPKANGKLRPLGIPTMEDKILQSSTAKILQTIYEQDFLPSSFGYRPNIGAKDAVKSLTVNLQYGKFGYIVEADIKGFFDNLDHDWLVKMLRHRLNDEAFIRLIRKWLKSGILDTDNKVIHPVTGSPQGGIVSPVLANIYLHYVLDIWFERVVKKHIRGKALLCRYADDFVCAFQYKEDAEAFFRTLPKRLKKFGLEVAEEKTKIHRFSRFHLSIANRFVFLGFEFRWSLDNRGVARVKKRTAPTKLRSALRNFTEWAKRIRGLPISKVMSTLSAKLRGYYNYFGVICNYASICSFYFRSMEILLKWLNKRSQRRSYSWQGFTQVLEQFDIPKPCIVEPRNVRNAVILI